MKKNVSIQIIRICAMFFIIICHLVSESNNNFIVQTAQFFNVGVYIFLFLSGYLYGKKKIENNKEWLIGRAKKIMIPTYCFVVFLTLIHIMRNTMDFKYIFIHLFDLQYYLGGLGGAQHLWFVSIIMICYIVNVHLQYNNKIIMNKKNVSGAVLEGIENTIGIGTIEDTESSSSKVDVTIILGRDYNNK